MKLEPGKTYIDRRGDVHGPMEERTPGLWLDQYGAVYQSDGREWNHVADSASTLVREAQP